MKIFYIFHTIDEIKIGNPRFHALIEFDLHSFDQNIFTFDNTVEPPVRLPLINDRQSKTPKVSQSKPYSWNL